MKRSVVLSIALGSLILIMSLGTNAYQHSQVKQAQQQISRLQQQKRQVSQQLTKTNQQKQLLSTQIDSYKTYQNNKDKSTAEIDFNNTTNEFLKYMFTFEPDSYKTRKEHIKGLISNDLYNQYFPSNQNFGDSNNVSSKLDQAKVYTRAKQDQNIDGLAVITFESKTGSNDFKKQTVLYQLSYDTTAKQLTKVKSLGDSFEASDIQ
ncbi:hypothetical protein ACA590_14415 [Lactiplantibacillus plantarum]|jgi:hypothetical protein|uniref:Uncharacterized protein n=6 Tax=Lactobacillaceae TaxID=33958 RepID=A0AAX1KDY5_LACPN|nr:MULTISPECIES: hypothetical protein [Lactobacillaceae]ARO02365.1 hypothetical protein BIZ31_15615 [Lactiplantibacillus plantarum]ARO05339.1 hypothetical protein BIZ32_15780 [Lactiplantibacillus plantarum]ATL80174.1 hypothetical protein CRG99_16605 [Lactiplantibacillus plantarum]MBP5818186.1 hypothetical protein [Lactiplantibacillus plantarum]MBP5835462.1 hypothetical protein [Lactiplantibacillus plantarum]